jgi:TRAP-type transport system periplasmic protein
MRFIRSIRMTVVLVALLGGVFLGGFNLSPALGAAGPVELKATFYYPETDAFARNTKEWMATISEKTNGRVKFTPFWAGSLVSLPDTLDAVREGSADVGEIAASFYTGKIPGVGAFEPTGSTSTDTVKYSVMLDKVEPVVKSMFDEQKVVFPFFMHPGAGTNMVAKNRNIKNIADFKGLKIRHSGRWGQAQFKAIGVNTVVVAPGEVYQALQTGVVDAAMGLNSLSLSFKWYEVAPYVTSFDMTSNMNFILINKSAWDRVSADDQKIMIEVSKQASRTALSRLKEFQLDAYRRMESQGAKAYTWNAQEKAEFLKATSAVWDEIKKAADPYAGQLVDIMAEYRQ